MYVRVYAPNGEPFDVTRERADTLLLQKGWTQTPVVTEDISDETVNKFETLIEALSDVVGADEPNELIEDLPFTETADEALVYEPVTELPEIADEMQEEVKKPRRSRKKAADADNSQD